MSDITILLIAGLAGLATLVGVFFGGLFNRTKRNIIFSASFSASLMVLISLLELIPTAAKNTDIISVVIWVLVGALTIWLANVIVPHMHSVKEIKDFKDKSLTKMSYLIAVGLVLHDFPEGFAIPSSFNNSESLGFMVVLATFFHNVPEGYILTVSQPKSPKNNFCFKASVSSAVATVLGALLGISLLTTFRNLSTVFLCLAAGAMLFLAAHELLPESYRHKDIKTFVFGIGSAILVYFLLGLI